MTLWKMVDWPVSAARAMRAMVGEHRFRSQLLAKYEGLRLGKYVDVRSPDRLKLGRNATIETGVLLHCGGFDWSDHEGGITIGNDCYIGPNCVLFGAGGISVGAKSMLSPGVVVTSHGHRIDQPETPVHDLPSIFETVVIHENVWVGSNATILPGEAGAHFLSPRTKRRPATEPWSPGCSAVSMHTDSSPKSRRSRRFRVSLAGRRTTSTAIKLREVAYRGSLRRCLR